MVSFNVSDANTLEGVTVARKSGRLIAIMLIGILAVPATLATPAVPDAAAAASSCTGRHWVRAWGASPSSASEQTFTSQTIRTVLTPLTAGGTVRIRLSNRFGSVPVRFGAVTVGASGAGAHVVKGTNRSVRFRGGKAVTVPAGAERLSDPVRFRVRPFQNVTVALYISGTSGPATSHPYGRQTSYYTAPGSGNKTGGPASAFTETTTSRFFISGLDVRRSRRVGTVVTLGDSITDGFQGKLVPLQENIDGIDRPVRYPDFLARRLVRSDRAFGVMNAGISGNRVVSPGLIPAMGPSAVSRFRADVLAVPGVTDVILMEGTNDLGQTPDPVAEAPRVIEGLRRIVTALRRSGLEVMLGTIPPAGGTLTPMYGTPAHERARSQVNHWIRTSGVASSVIDFDKVLRDASAPTRLLPVYDSSDHLHPNTAGYRAMARAVPLDKLKGPRC